MRAKFKPSTISTVRLTGPIGPEPGADEAMYTDRPVRAAAKLHPRPNSRPLQNRGAAGALRVSEDSGLRARNIAGQPRRLCPEFNSYVARRTQM